MAPRLIPGFLAALMLAGCSDRLADYPALLPTEQLLAEPALPAHAAGTDPATVGDALSGRAAVLAGQGAPNPGTAGDLAGRADALRARAQALSRRSLDDCPKDAATCDTAPAADQTDQTSERP